MSRRAKLVRRAAIGALVAGVVTPVAASAAMPFGSSAATVSAASKSKVVHITEQDAGRTVHVGPGARIALDLHGSYDPATVDHPEVLRQTSHSGGYPNKSDAKASFTALAAGSATITSRLDSDCMHPAAGHMRCMMMPAPLTIDIVVDDPTAILGNKTGTSTAAPIFKLVPTTKRSKHSK